MEERGVARIGRYDRLPRPTTLVSQATPLHMILVKGRGIRGGMPGSKGHKLKHHVALCNVVIIIIIRGNLSSPSRPWPWLYTLPLA